MWNYSFLLRRILSCRRCFAKHSQFSAKKSTASHRVTTDLLFSTTFAVLHQGLRRPSSVLWKIESYFSLPNLKLYPVQIQTRSVATQADPKHPFQALRYRPSTVPIPFSHNFLPAFGNYLLHPRCRCCPLNFSHHLIYQLLVVLYLVLQAAGNWEIFSSPLISNFPIS